jgi:hypothetical protein
MGERKNEENNGFFSKNFNVLNFLIQGGILLTILSFVFKSGVYYEQVNKIIDEILIIKKDQKEMKDKNIEFDKKIDIIIRDNMLEETNNDKLEEKIEILQKCQKNKKNC